MAIEPKPPKEIPSNLYTTYKKAGDALLKGSDEYGIVLLKGVVQKVPGFMEARKKLRECEKKKTDNIGVFAKMMIPLKTASKITKGRTLLVRKKYLEAMAAAEDALQLSLNNLAALNLLADAAEEADGLFIAIEALEIAYEYNPENETVMRNLSRLYEIDGQGSKVLQIMQKIASKHPKNLEVQQELRAAAALATMEQGKWQEEGDFHDKLKDEAESKNIEQEDRIVRNPDDIREMIERIEEKINSGDESIDLRRKIAELYHRGGHFEKAIETYNWIIEKMGSMDPAIDFSIEKAQLGIFDQRINEFKESGAPEEKIQEIETERYAYRLERAEDRVYNFPNDNELRYLLAVVYWDGNNLDKALEQFQSARKNPQRRITSLVYLGQCFAKKKQYDLSIEQFEKAISEMHIMDKIKMNAVYHLGVTFDEMGDHEKAVQCFKDIYQADINYRDVAERMDKIYKEKQQ